MCPFYDAFDFNRDGKLDGLETAIAYTVLFGDPQEEQEGQDAASNKDDGGWRQ